MAGEAQDNTWPLPKFYFMVDWGNMLNIPFLEVSGLDAETDIIEYREGNVSEFSVIKMPGLKKFGNVTLKRGMFSDSDVFWKWHEKIKMNTIEREEITIKLLDETGNPTMVWTLSNAWPTKISSLDLKSDGNEVAIESIEVAHEGLRVGNGV